MGERLFCEWGFLDGRRSKSEGEGEKVFRSCAFRAYFYAEKPRALLLFAEMPPYQCAFEYFIDFLGVNLWYQTDRSTHQSTIDSVCLHRISQVLAWIFRVLMLVSRTRLTSTFTRVHKYFYQIWFDWSEQFQWNHVPDWYSCFILRFLWWSRRSSLIWSILVLESILLVLLMFIVALSIAVREKPCIYSWQDPLTVMNLQFLSVRLLQPTVENLQFFNCTLKIGRQSDYKHQ